jgi:hypothetical protein
MKEETLEEAAERYVKDKWEPAKEETKESFIDGAKWQQEKIYSEEEVKKIINDIVEKHCTYFEQKIKDGVKLEWFKQIKKK